MTPAEQLARALRESGSTVAFGVPGGGPNLDVVGALEAAGIRFVLAHGETAACIMAATSGLLTGTPGATVVTRGPGAASAVNGAAQATLDRHPLVLVTDTVPRSHRDRVPHQRIDQQAMFTPVTKGSFVLGAETPVEALTTAVASALAAPAGCVHLDYDASTPGSGTDTMPIVDQPVPAGPDDAAVHEARRLIEASRRPVVIVGLDANRSSARVRRAIESFGAPVMTTYQAIGMLDTESPLNAGLFTNGASERPLLTGADLIVTVGMDFVEPIPADWTFEAPVVSLSGVGSDANSDRYAPVAVDVVGDLATLTAELLVGGHGWDADAGAAHREALRADLRHTGEGSAFGPTELVDACVAAAPDDATVTVDAGAHFLAIMPLWPTPVSRRLLISNGLATMGYAVPAAIGAALARPGAPVIALTGDGGLGMCLAELETIVRLDLAITVVVFNDAGLSLIEIKQRAGHGGTGAVRYLPTDFAAIAEACGMSGFVATSPADVTAALSADARGPRLIDARIDPGAYPDLIRITRG